MLVGGPGEAAAGAAPAAAAGGTVVSWVADLQVDYRNPRVPRGTYVSADSCECAVRGPTSDSPEI